MEMQCCRFEAFPECKWLMFDRAARSWNGCSHKIVSHENHGKYKHAWAVISQGHCLQNECRWNMETSNVLKFTTQLQCNCRISIQLWVTQWAHKCVNTNGINNNKTKTYSHSFSCSSHLPQAKLCLWFYMPRMFGNEQLCTIGTMADCVRFSPSLPP